MKVRLENCVEILDSKRVPLSSSEREKLDKVYPYYGAQGVIDYVDDFIFDGEYILVAEDGNNLKTLSENIATWATGRFWANNHAHILGKKEGYCLRYIYYLLNSLDLRGFITGSAQPKLNQENLARIELDLPDYSTQCEIAKILTKIDTKIANNEGIRSDFESIARLIYNFWFVQYNFPNSNKKPYRLSGGKMVWNDELNKEIPNDWEVKRLGDIIRFTKGKIPEKLSKKPLGSLSSPYITIDVANGGLPDYCDSEAMVQCDGETIMVMDGAASGDVYLGNVGSLGSTFSMLSSKRDDISDSLIYMILQSNTAVYKRANTGSTVPHANRHFIEKMKIALPKDLSVLSKQFDSILSGVIGAKDENRQLAGFRDFILPLLMNRQVRIDN